MYFEVLQSRLVDNLRQRVQNGEVTERSLARCTGISQPHIHNLVKGVRSLSPEIADRILRTLRITLLDLFDTDELDGRSPVRSESYQPHRDLSGSPVQASAGIPLPAVQRVEGPVLLDHARGPRDRAHTILAQTATVR